MTGARLKNLVIENFRSLRGKVVIPLDAQVVLIHGTNGMGKTSVLSAMELALTGKVAHLAADGPRYQSYLTTLDTGGGSISLTTTAPLTAGSAVAGSLAFSDDTFVPKPLLDSDNARFFAERCYLPQATLGRLLEIYDDQKIGTTSPLTLFVKELLGLDPLDALVDGLDHAFNVTRVRKLVPDFKRLEALRTSLEDDRRRKDKAIDDATKSVADQLTRLNEVLSTLAHNGTAPVVTDATDIDQFKADLNTSDDGPPVSTLIRTRSELRALQERWKALPSQEASRDQASKERAELAAVEALAAWRSTDGNALEALINATRASFTDIPPAEDSPEDSRSEARRRVQAEADRCSRLLAVHATASAQIAELNTVVQRASTRIAELNQDLSGAAEGAKTLANALAGIVPHIDGETCPVCSRNYAELEAGSLSAHVAGKIALLTNESGRLQALATARAEECSRLATAQRDLLSATNGHLSSEEFAEFTMRQAEMSNLAQRLADMKEAAAAGSLLIANAAAARQAVLTVRRREEQSISLLPEIDIVVQSVLQRSSSSFETIDVALAEALRMLDAHVTEAERVAAVKVLASSELDNRTRNLTQISILKSERDDVLTRLQALEIAFKDIDATRTNAKKVSEAADSVRSAIVKKVFNTSLNKIWRDLFVRLAPSEQFVPAFRLPVGSGGKVEAVLETLHRSGKTSGSPGAMLSQGNLNTAALTLFLALHLSVPVHMPWLILDDPVQSMDDVHIAQFAALLRSLSKGMNRQVVIAVHERALFDYLSLELSPAFPGDSLITVEITRNFEGEAVATPRAFIFEEDHALAA
ncbi:AAA family ATPase [Cupriavidus necator]|uniref:AAA family ATPase n=1 Tax=Cupriavidus necator TaxID=106590 RepID=UPI003ECF17B2